MFKRIFFLGLTAGIMASLAAVIFRRIHEFATYTDFSNIVSVQLLLAINIGVCMMASVLFFILQKLLGQKSRFVFNLVFVLMSFISITWSFAITLPLDVQFPELFPGLTVPMHFFPALAWFTFEPLFITSPRAQVNNKKNQFEEIHEMEL